MLPQGWSCYPTGKDYISRRSEEGAFAGSYSGVLKSIKGARCDGWGSLYQYVDAVQWRGREVILSAAMRTIIPDGQNTVVRLYLTAYDRSGAKLQDFTYRMYSIQEPEWGVYELAADLPQETATLSVNFNQLGRGETWVDSVSIRLAPKRADGLPYHALVLNDQFNLGASGGEPWLWYVPNHLQAQGGTARIIARKDVKEGRCALITPASLESGEYQGRLVQHVDASAYRKKTVELSASVRVDSKAGGVGSVRLWIQVEEEGERDGFGGQILYEAVSDKPASSKEWTRIRVEFPVEYAGAQLNLGVVSSGPANVLVDDFSLVVIESEQDD